MDTNSRAYMMVHMATENKTDQKKACNNPLAVDKKYDSHKKVENWISNNFSDVLSEPAPEPDRIKIIQNVINQKKEEQEVLESEYLVKYLNNDEEPIIISTKTEPFDLSPVNKSLLNTQIVSALHKGDKSEITQTDPYLFECSPTDTFDNIPNGLVEWKTDNSQRISDSSYVSETTYGGNKDANIIMDKNIVSSIFESTQVEGSTFSNLQDANKNENLYDRVLSDVSAITPEYSQDMSGEISFAEKNQVGPSISDCSHVSETTYGGNDDANIIMEKNIDPHISEFPLVKGSTLCNLPGARYDENLNYRVLSNVSGITLKSTHDIIGEIPMIGEKTEAGSLKENVSESEDDSRDLTDKNKQVVRKSEYLVKYLNNDEEPRIISTNTDSFDLSAVNKSLLNTQIVSALHKGDKSEITQTDPYLFECSPTNTFDNPPIDLVEVKTDNSQHISDCSYVSETTYGGNEDANISMEKYIDPSIFEFTQAEGLTFSNLHTALDEENLCDPVFSNLSGITPESSQDTSGEIPISEKIQTGPLQENVSESEDDEDDSRDKTYVLSDNYSSIDTSTSNSIIDEATEVDPANSGILSSGHIEDFDGAITTTDNSNITHNRITSLAEEIKAKKNKKHVLCKFCDVEILSTNFLRHLERHHQSETEIKKILEHPKKSKARRQALAALRNETNFDLYISGTLKPKREIKEIDESKYFPCAYCKALFFKKYLRRHIKKCLAFKAYKSTRGEEESSENLGIISRSQTVTACASDPTNTIATLNVKEQVFDLMKGDSIAYEAKKDLLIAHFGNSYLKKHKRERMGYVCSNRMRELSRLLICYRKITNNDRVRLKDMLHPRHFDSVVSAVRLVVGFNPIEKTFNSPSLAMHLGTSLKLVCDEFTTLILKESNGFRFSNEHEAKTRLEEVKNFKKLVESRWNVELTSLANKDLQEKRWKKPLLVPLVSDIKKFREETLNIANQCKELFLKNEDNKNTYKDLIQCVLSLLIVFNRRRIGDVQFLKIKDYQQDKKTDFTDFESVLTDTEKMLTKKYKRVVNSGKGSRAVVILVPEIIQEFIKVLLKHREKYISNDNEYLFALPDSRVKWGKGDVAIRWLTTKIQLENPQAISSNKLRKHIATVMQILSLSSEETKQFSDFMGHTEKTHRDFYELPVDIYQTAKVSKILLMMEKGAVPAEYRGKALSDIKFDSNLEYAEESDEENRDHAVKPREDIFSKPLEEIIDDEIFQKKTVKQVETSSSEKDVEVQSETESIEEHASKKINQKKPRRNPWTAKEIAILKRTFKKFINSGQYPSSDEIDNFMKNNNIKRTVSVIRSKIQHLIKSGDKL